MAGGRHRPGRGPCRGLQRQPADDLGRAGPLPERFQGHAYQLYERAAPTLADDGVLLVGDAAGLAYPQSGEGIRPAVESAIIWPSHSGRFLKLATMILPRASSELAMMAPNSARALPASTMNFQGSTL